MVRLLVHSKDLWPRPPHVKHLMELVLMVSSVGVVDDEALGLKLLVVGGRLEVVEVFFELDLSPLLVGVGVVEACEL
jgi:hypothetical protein